jgi:hypothetical protein
LTESSLVTKHGSIIMGWRINGRVWNGYIHNPPGRKVQKPTIQGKLMLKVFWDSLGLVMERGTAINSAHYSEMPAIRSKLQGLLQKGVVSLHNNARLHTACCPHS